LLTFSVVLSEGLGERVVDLLLVGIDMSGEVGGSSVKVVEVDGDG
jgi:hypothetical protein